MILAAGAFASVAILGPLPSKAADAEIPVNAETVGHRINLAGRQRMLLERMAKMFCYARSGVDVMASVENLTKSKDMFAATHTAFSQGDAAMKIFPETVDSVRDSWIKVNGDWAVLSEIYDRALGGAFVSEEDFATANAVTLSTRKEANDMVAQLRTAYAPQLGGGGFGSAILIDLYGRQRMLSQKLSKEVCLVARGHELDKTRPELAATLELFENSLNAFINGMPIAGVPVPPSDEIATQLAVAEAEWAAVADVAHAVAEGDAVSLVELERFAQGTDKFLPEMNKAVQLLAAHNAKTN
ncbi:MAG: type IV pili methyl-accepting chemotaxis transducer N-terminal domain-containing protein [Pseudomonadota bacterium]